MANFTKIKKIFLFAVLFLFGAVFAFLSPCLANENAITKENQKYQEIYEKLPEADFSYIFNLDPYQPEEYTKYMYAPYPLFRTAIRFVFKNTVIEPGYYLLTPREKDGKSYVLFKTNKNTVIEPGYYLLTPREKDGKSYVLFKTNGKVKYIIPVYEKDLVEPAFYERYVPERKLTWWQSVCQKTRNTMGRLFSKQTQRKPPPKSYIDVNELGTDYWQVILYYGATKYYMIFMR